jgi:hypothetical protein
MASSSRTVVASDSIPPGQTWLILIGKAFIPTMNQSGVCWGVTHMGVLALAAQDIRSLDTRFQLLYDLVNKKDPLKSQFALAMRDAQKSDSQGIQYGLSLSLRANLQDAIEVPINQAREKIVAEIATAKKLKPDHVKEALEAFHKRNPSYAPLLDIPIFIQNIDILYRPGEYAYLFEEKNKPTSIQDLSSALPLLSPASIDIPKMKEGKEEAKDAVLSEGVSNVANFSGFYSFVELSKYFNSLERVFINNPELQADVKKGIEILPFSLALGVAGHSIAVGYNIHARNWILIDANHLPSQQITNENIAYEIAKAFTEQEMPIVSFVTSAYVATHKKKVFESIMAQWQVTPEFLAIHKVTGEKALQRDDVGNMSWLHTEATIGNVEIFNQLIEKKSDINLSSQDGSTPLLFAVQYAKLAIVAILLAKNANCNCQRANGVSPLFLAVLQKNIIIAKMLLEAKANASLSVKNGMTALVSGTRYNDVDMIKLIRHYHKPSLVEVKEIWKALHESANNRFAILSEGERQVCKSVFDKICLVSTMLLSSLSHYTSSSLEQKAAVNILEMTMADAYEKILSAKTPPEANRCFNEFKAELVSTRYQTATYEAKSSSLFSVEGSNLSNKITTALNAGAPKVTPDVEVKPVTTTKPTL